MDLDFMEILHSEYNMYDRSVIATVNASHLKRK